MDCTPTNEDMLTQEGKLEAPFDWRKVPASPEGKEERVDPVPFATRSEKGVKEDILPFALATREAREGSEEEEISMIPRICKTPRTERTAAPIASTAMKLAAETFQHLRHLRAWLDVS